MVFVGDSITRGVVSSNWIEAVARRHGHRPIDFVNAGVNGDLAFNVAARLDEVVECRPDAVTLLIGTNDVQATYSERMERMFRRQNGLRSPPTLASYRSAVSEILEIVHRRTSARIAVIEIPMIGEDLGSPMNEKVDAYNVVLRALAEERGDDVLPIRAGLERLLTSGRTPPPYTADISLIVKASLAHGILRRSWNDISSRNGLEVLTDQVHLNDRAGAVIAKAVSVFVERLSQGHGQ
ncbi:SGNH/GDSL hydrolase family protein [Glaciibacter flavus]|uniref:SGNH/GDSL hydrolase family protein n=1 Tax=Orlajensenia flava TaxID=2565934 RepID=UPI0014552D63|nr:SGNH/GDSL hydrolase family protein [Glaciibacter flavus]